MHAYRNFLVICLLAFFTCACTQKRSLKSTAENRVIVVSEYVLTCDGLGVSVREKSLKDLSPSAPMSVLLPSATYSCAPNWDLQIANRSIMDRLAKDGWRVVAIDLPGYGKSDDPEGPNRFGARKQRPILHEALNKIRAKHKVKKVALVGWSWGAQVAGHYAEEHPENVSHLVLYGYTWAMRHSESGFPRGFLQAPFRDLSRNGALSDFIEGCSDPAVGEAYAKACLQADSNVPLGSLNDFVHELPLTSPQKITMPCLVISGQYELSPHESFDDIQKIAVAARAEDLETFCAKLPPKNRHVATIPNGGHAVHLENTEAWYETVKKFLESDLN